MKYGLKEQHHDELFTCGFLIWIDCRQELVWLHGVSMFQPSVASVLGMAKHKTTCSSIANTVTKFGAVSCLGLELLSICIAHGQNSYLGSSRFQWQLLLPFEKSQLKSQPIT